ncbi:MAG: class I SAM-dependent methyltransferase [Parcubacteria group bacterium]|nr:class I SAM-dependent methyltransferase [Parcubacteria group bacterium]
MHFTELLGLDLDILLLNQYSHIHQSKNKFKKYKEFIFEPFLDFGCGNGACLLAGKSEGLNHFIGVDISYSALKVCKDQGLENIIKYDGSGKIQAIKDNTIGTIHSSQVFEHIPRVEADQLLMEFYRILKPKGTLLLFFPAEASERYNPDPSHINFYKIDEFINYIQDIGFQVNLFWSQLFIPPFDKYTMEITDFFSRNMPLINTVTYGFRKLSYSLIKKYLYNSIQGTQINIIATKN